MNIIVPPGAADAIDTAPKIINPFAEKQEKELRQGRVLDIKNMARQLVLNSYAAGNRECRLSSEEAFALAQHHRDLEEKLFPKNNTPDGTEVDG